MDAGIREVLQKFFPGEELVSVGAHGSGNINHPFAVEGRSLLRRRRPPRSTRMWKD